MNNSKDKCLSRSVSHEMVVGVFVLTIFAALVLFTIILSGSGLFQGDGTRLSVEFDSVGGLRKHDYVLVRGVPVGEVENLRLHEDGVLVQLSLRQKVAIRQTYSIQAQSSSLLGGMQLVINEGTGDVIPEDTILKGMPPENVMENINELVTDVRNSLDEGGILTNLQVAIADISLITTRLRNGEGTLGKLLSTNDTVYANLNTTIANLSSISERLEKGEGTLGKLLSTNDTLYANLETTIANLSSISERLEKGEGTLGKLLSTNDTLYANLETTIANISSISERLEKGEGTLGKLLSTDSTLYDDLQSAVAGIKSIVTRVENGEGLLGELVSKDGTIGRELNGLIKDGRDMLDDMRETSPISTFSSIFFGAF